MAKSKKVIIILNPVPEVVKILYLFQVKFEEFELVPETNLVIEYS